MSSLDIAFRDVIWNPANPSSSLEGGYSNDPNDAGGETKYGIAKRWHPNIDIKNLTLEGAKQIYRLEYWNPMLLWKIVSDDFTTEIFEQAINMGRHQSVLHIQRSYNLISVNQLVVDGALGTKTVDALNGLGSNRSTAFLKCMNGEQYQRYKEIIANDPTQRGFFVGWLRRIDMATV
jgi:lysozyme family protein